MIALLDEQVDHALESESLSVGGREDPLDTVGLELLDLGVHDDTAAAAVDPDVRTSLVPEAVDQVPEVLDVAALIGADRDSLDILLDGGPDHFVDRAVVPEVDDLGPLRLEQSPHDVDGGVVPVEETGRGHEPDRMVRSVEVAHRG